MWSASHAARRELLVATPADENHRRARADDQEDALGCALIENAKRADGIVGSGTPMHSR
jgi:hypothetical protein